MAAPRALALRCRVPETPPPPADRAPPPPPPAPWRSRAPRTAPLSPLLLPCCAGRQDQAPAGQRGHVWQVLADGQGGGQEVHSCSALAHTQARAAPLRDATRPCTRPPPCPPPPLTATARPARPPPCSKWRAAATPPSSTPTWSRTSSCVASCAALRARARAAPLPCGALGSSCCPPSPHPCAPPPRTLTLPLPSPPPPASAEQGRGAQEARVLVPGGLRGL